MITPKDPTTRLTTAGNQHFHSAGPKLWNILPTQIHYSETLNQFKIKSKTPLPGGNTTNYCTIALFFII